MPATDEILIVGKVSGVFGVQGWVKVYSYTDPREKISEYNPWYIKQSGFNNATWTEVLVEKGRKQAKTVVVKLEGCDDRDAAMLMTGSVVGIHKGQLQTLPASEYYWRDLIGLRVVDKDGEDFGVVQKLLETGANDVLVVNDEINNEYLIPWTQGKAIVDVDLDGGLITVDWQKSY